MIDLRELAGLEALSPLELALEWARRGVPVLPTNPDTKAPWVGKEWEKKASTDSERIRAMWAMRPTGRVGIKTGLACECGCEDGPTVLDFDVSEGKPGIAQRQVLVLADLLDGTQALRVQTPSGGEHWWFAPDSQHNKQHDDDVWGVDLRGHHGMVLAPGNPGYIVKGVPWDKLGNAPDWSLVAACPGIVANPKRRKSGDRARVADAVVPGVAAAPVRSSRLVSPLRGEFHNEVGEESPLDWYCRTHSFDDLLRQDGWTYAYEHQERRYWVRPGKDPKDGVSANVYVNPDGRETLVNFSSSVDLPTDRGLSAAQYFAYTRHRGDVRGAAGVIRKTLMPQRTRPVASPANRPPVVGMPMGVAPPVAPVATTSGDLVPVSEAGIPEPVRDFWNRRPELREVWFRSAIEDVSPWAVLGHVLANVAGRVGPHVRLPPKGGYGSPTSLNILVAVSGNSGEGKGVSGQVARGLMGTPRPPQRKPGTGQGIAAMFTEQTKEGPVQSNDTVVLNVAEITQLGAHMGQQGATITSTLLEVYMAEELGEHYANKELRRPVKEGAYRLALVAGVQPDNAGILFDHAASGLPQRFLWFPAHWDDAVLPESGLVPPAPGSPPPVFRGWHRVLPGTLDDSLQVGPEWSPADAATALQTPGGGKKAKEPEALPAPVKEEILVTYGPAMASDVRLDSRRRRNAIKAANERQEDGAGDPDSHLVLTRIKAATLLAIWLDHTTHVSDEMWELARWVIWVSTWTRQKAHGRIRAKEAEKTQRRAASQVATRQAVEAARSADEDALIRKIAMRVRAILEKTPGAWVATRILSQGIAGRDKAKLKEANIELADILHDMVSLGEIETEEQSKNGNTATMWRK